MHSLSVLTTVHACTADILARIRWLTVLSLWWRKRLLLQRVHVPSVPDRDNADLGTRIVAVLAARSSTVPRDYEPVLVGGRGCSCLDPDLLPNLYGQLCGSLFFASQLLAAPLPPWILHN